MKSIISAIILAFATMVIATPAMAYEKKAKSGSYSSYKPKSGGYKSKKSY